MKVFLLLLAVGVATARFLDSPLVDVARPLLLKAKFLTARSTLDQKPLSAALGFKHPQLDVFQREIQLNISNIIVDHLNDILNQIQTVTEAAQQIAANLTQEFEALIHDLLGESDIWQNIQNFLSALQGGIGDVLQNILSAMGFTRRLDAIDIRSALRVRMEKDISDWWQNVVNWFSDAWQDIQSTLGDAWTVVSQWAQEGWGTVSESATSAWEWISDKWTEFSAWAGKFWNSAVDAASPAIQQVQQLAQAFVTWASENLGSLSQNLMAQALAFFQAHKDEIGDFLWEKLLSLAASILVG